MQKMTQYEKLDLLEKKRLRRVFTSMARYLHRIVLVLEKPSTPKVPTSVRWHVGIPKNEGE